jgi:ferric-dicitrate binding protein FerR (iron transport regulator)
MTNPIAPFEKDVVKEAIMWVIRLQSAGETLATIQACEHWRMAHQSHEQAWQHIQGLVTQMRQGSAALSNHQASKILENAAQHMQRRRALKILSLSFTVGVSTWLASDLAAWQNLAADYATAVGVTRNKLL